MISAIGFGMPWLADTYLLQWRKPTADELWKSRYCGTQSSLKVSRELFLSQCSYKRESASASFSWSVIRIWIFFRWTLENSHPLPLLQVPPQSRQLPALIERQGWQVLEFGDVATTCAIINYAAGGFLKVGKYISTDNQDQRRHYL